MHPTEKKADWKEILDRSLAVWKKRGIRPKYHVSEQQPERRIGTHSHYLNNMPQPLLDRQDQFPDEPFDIMLECKQKDLALAKVLKLYPGRYE